MAATAMAPLKLASESKRSVVTVQLAPHFKARVLVAVLSLCMISGFVGGGLMLDARAMAQSSKSETMAADSAADQHRDDRIEYNERSVVELKDVVKEQQKAIEEFKQEVSAVRGAMWVGGLILSLLHLTNLLLTIRSGIKRIEKEHNG